MLFLYEVYILTLGKRYELNKISILMVQLFTEKGGQPMASPLQGEERLTKNLKQVEQVNATFLSLSRKLKKEKTTENIYDYFLNYFQAVDRVFKTVPPKKYCVSGILFDRVILVNSKDEQSISIYHNNNLYYHAIYQEQLIEAKNSFSSDELKKIKLLPQTEEAVIKEYFARYLTKYLLENLSKLDTSEQEIIWKLADENGRFQVYTFYMTSCSQNKSTLIFGQDSCGAIIFQAEILYCQVINFIENKISKLNLSQFVNWCLNQ